MFTDVDKIDSTSLILHPNNNFACLAYDSYKA